MPPVVCKHLVKYGANGISSAHHVVLIDFCTQGLGCSLAFLAKRHHVCACLCYSVIARRISIVLRSVSWLLVQMIPAFYSFASRKLMQQPDAAFLRGQAVRKGFNGKFAALHVVLAQFAAGGNLLATLVLDNSTLVSGVNAPTPVEMQAGAHSRALANHQISIRTKNATFSLVRNTAASTPPVTPRASVVGRATSDARRNSTNPTLPIDDSTNASWAVPVVVGVLLRVLWHVMSECMLPFCLRSSRKPHVQLCSWVHS